MAVLSSGFTETFRTPESFSVPKFSSTLSTKSGPEAQNICAQQGRWGRANWELSVDMTANLMVGSREKKGRKWPLHCPVCPSFLLRQVCHSCEILTWPSHPSLVIRLLGKRPRWQTLSIPFASGSLLQKAAALWGSNTWWRENSCKQIPCDWSSNLDQSLQSPVTSIMILSPPFPSPSMKDEWLCGTSPRAVMGIRLAWLQKIYISWYGCDESFHYSSAIALLLLLICSHSLSFFYK